MPKVYIPDLDDSERAEAISLLEDSITQDNKPKKAETPLYTQEEVSAALDQMSRKPFAQFLALLLGAHPTEQNVRDFANRNPDKWASAVNLFSKMTGYSETININANISHIVTQLSDKDLEAYLRQTNHQIGDSYLVDPTTIEVPPEPMLIEEQTTPSIQKSRAIHEKANGHNHVTTTNGTKIRKKAHNPKVYSVFQKPE